MISLHRKISCLVLLLAASYSLKSAPAYAESAQRPLGLLNRLAIKASILSHRLNPTQFLHEEIERKRQWAAHEEGFRARREYYRANWAEYEQLMQQGVDEFLRKVDIERETQKAISEFGDSDTFYIERHLERLGAVRTSVGKAKISFRNHKMFIDISENPETDWLSLISLSPLTTEDMPHVAQSVSIAQIDGRKHESRRKDNEDWRPIGEDAVVFAPNWEKPQEHDRALPLTGDFKRDAVLKLKASLKRWGNIMGKVDSTPNIASFAAFCGALQAGWVICGAATEAAIDGKPIVDSMLSAKALSAAAWVALYGSLTAPFSKPLANWKRLGKGPSRFIRDLIPFSLIFYVVQKSIDAGYMDFHLFTFVVAFLIVRKSTTERIYATLRERLRNRVDRGYITVLGVKWDREMYVQQTHWIYQFQFMLTNLGLVLDKVPGIDGLADLMTSTDQGHQMAAKALTLAAMFVIGHASGDAILYWTAKNTPNARMGEVLYPKFWEALERELEAFVGKGDAFQDTRQIVNTLRDKRRNNPAAVAAAIQKRLEKDLQELKYISTSGYCPGAFTP